MLVYAVVQGVGGGARALVPVGPLGTGVGIPLVIRGGYVGQVRRGGRFVTYRIGLSRAGTGACWLGLRGRELLEGTARGPHAQLYHGLR